MTKLIAALIVAVALFIGYELFLYWDKVKNDEESARREAAAKVITNGAQLQGMSWQLGQIYERAQQKGVSGVSAFLKTYGDKIQDPRKAWIEMDYCQLIAHANPAEARSTFAAVKARTPTNSPIVPRIKQLERTFE
jgi:hypothetical protein